MDKDKNVFVIMPFSPAKTCTEAEWAQIYETIFRPAIEECGYLCERTRPETGSLIRTIIEKLKNSTIVLADLTDRNPNVLYELGVRHSISKRTIMVAQSIDDIPSDLRGFWTITYGTRQWEVDKFRSDIKRIISEIGEHPDRSDSPVSDYLEREDIINGTDISYKPEVRRIVKEPLLIDKLQKKVRIDPDFLEWHIFSILFWCRLTRDFISKAKYKYLFSYVPMSMGSGKHPNGFYFGMYNSEWLFRIIGPNPQDRTTIAFPRSDRFTNIHEGWNLFSIRWNRDFMRIELDVLNIDSESRFNLGKLINPESWPKKVEEHFLELGGWTNAFPGGISSLEFYDFCLYKASISDRFINHMFQVERDSIRKFL